MKISKIFARSYAGMALLGLTWGALGCGAAESASGSELQQAASEGELASAGSQYEDHVEGLSLVRAACSQLEAEGMQHSAGSLVVDGWKLTQQGQNISTNRQFVTGAHSFSIMAKTDSAFGTYPQLKVTLNGIQIGSNITVSNTGSYQEYVIHYSVTTANSKLIKVEVANISPRSVSIDGINVYCPRPKVVCGDNLSCNSCCRDQISGTETCEPDFCPGTQGSTGFTCDQPSDCTGGQICAAKGNNNGAGIRCLAPSECKNSSNPLVVCAEICKSPASPETPCTQGGTCTDFGPGMPGWKQCNKPIP